MGLVIAIIVETLILMWVVFRLLSIQWALQKERYSLESYTRSLAQLRAEGYFKEWSEIQSTLSCMSSTFVISPFVRNEMLCSRQLYTCWIPEDIVSKYHTEVTKQPALDDHKLLPEFCKWLVSVVQGKTDAIVWVTALPEDISKLSVIELREELKNRYGAKDSRVLHLMNSK